MSLSISIRGFNPLTPEQFNAVHDIIINMMNRKIKLKEAERQIKEKLQELNMPLQPLVNNN